MTQLPQPNPLRVVCVAGARPNYMKIKPVMDALETRGAQVHLVHTGQHYDAAMNDVFFAELGIRPPDHLLAVGSGTHAAQTAKVMTAFEPLVDELRPDVVVVVGDVNSTVACALVAAKAGCLVAHVEAGLRSRDWGMPEEINRVVTDRVSDYLLAPSADAAENLRAEGYRPDQVHVVGNVMVDTLLANLDRARQAGTVQRLGLTAGRVRAGHPAPAGERGRPGFAAAAAVRPQHGRRRAAAGVPGAPAHPGRARAAPSCTAQLRLLPPAGYLDFLALQADAALVLTDSGGIQEETTVLGVPCLTLRDNTERPITVTEGTNRVIGRDPDRIVEAALDVLRVPPPARRPALWDGRAGERIAEVLLTGGRAASRPRPTDLADTAPAAQTGGRAANLPG